MSDVIALTGLRVWGRHGVFEHERRDGQEFVVDAVLHVDTSAAAASDDLPDTIDYGTLAQDLAAVISGTPYNLIEAVAEQLVAVCLKDPRVGQATVTLHKPSAPIPLTFADVAVTITRNQAGGQRHGACGADAGGQRHGACGADAGGQRHGACGADAGDTT